MKSNTFNYSLLAVGIAAVLGISSTANADPAQSGSTTTSIDITNQASATYKVSNETQPEAKSNTVKITISEQVSFSLSADNDDTAVGGTQFDASNIQAEVAPDGFVFFSHTLKNTGNRTDTYAMTSPSAPANFDITKSSTSYKIYNAEGVEDKTRSVDNVPYGASSGRVFPLEKGHYIRFVIKAKTTGNKGGTTQSLPISAVSTILGAGKTLTNTNTSFTKLPTFNIVKTITNALDVNDSNDTATYQILVTNDGNTPFSTDATDIAIEDFLPAGLVMATSLVSSNIKVSGNATPGTIAIAGTNGFKITGVNIPVGQSVTITFNVKQDGSGTLDPATAINHVTVTDDLDNNALTANTLIDSTDTSREQNVIAFYTGSQNNFVNGQTPVTPGDDSTLPLLTIKRSLSLTNPTTREIAPTSGTNGQVTHQTVITNTGKDIEGSKAGELTFTITDNDGNTPDAINIVPASVTIVYDPDGAGPLQAQEAKSISSVGGVYDLFTALPSGIIPTGTVTINYKVSSLKAPLFTPLNSIDSTFENTIVTLIPKLEGAPAQVTVTDTTTVRGLVLVKKQAINATCTGTPADADFVTTEITGASPGECIIYRVQAQNTSTAVLGFDITDVVILDELAKFSANADYVDGSATTTASAGGTYTASNNGTAITSTIAALAPQGTATMQFKVKIKTARVVTPTP